MTSLIMKECKSPYIYSAVQAVTNLLLHSAPHSTIPSFRLPQAIVEAQAPSKITHTHTHTINKVKWPTDSETVFYGK
jgi:hypothetical protein